MNQLFEWISGMFRGVQCWAVVLPWERAIRVRFGKHMAVWEPGFHLRIPIFDEVKSFNTRLRLATFPSLTVTTRDQKTVTAAGLVGFRISDPMKAMLAVVQPEATLGGLAMSFVAKYVAERVFSEIVAEKLELSARTAILDQVPGFDVDFVRLVDFAAVRTYRLLQDGWRPSTSAEGAL